LIIKELNQSNEGLPQQVKGLAEACSQQDGVPEELGLDTSFNFNPDMNSIFLMYEGERLISALTVFAPSCEEGEISAMTLPEYRGRGCFTELVKRAEEELKKYGVEDILFVCEGRSATGKAAIAKQQGKYQFTEDSLRYNHSMDERIKAYEYKTKLRKAGFDDIESIIKISMAVFHDSYEGAKTLALGTLKAENRQLFLTEAEGQPVAMGASSKGEDATSIHGLGVLPEHQGKGYGKEILYSILNKLLEQGVENMLLEVESRNNRAYQLYRNTGFEVENSWEYYKRAVK
jgi:ribosomal protein S18 acetylase RimI-like enzyme